MVKNPITHLLTLDSYFEFHTQRPKKNGADVKLVLKINISYTSAALHHMREKLKSFFFFT
jgi:hypothetical protein